MSPLGKPICMTKDPSRGFQDILYIGVKTGYLVFMAKRCPKRFVLGFTESGKFYFYSKTLQQLMSSGYVYLVPRVFIRYTRVRTYSAWTSVLLVRNKGQYQSLVKRKILKNNRSSECEIRTAARSPAFLFAYEKHITEQHHPAQ